MAKQTPATPATVQAPATKPAPVVATQAPAQAPAPVQAPAQPPAAPAPVAPAPVAPVAAPAATHHAGIALASLPKNIAARGATGGVACPPNIAAVVMVAGKPPALRAPHVALWVQAALANLQAAGGRATGAALCAPVAVPVQPAQAAQFGLVPAPGNPGHYTLACPGHVLAYVLGGPVVKA